MAGNASKFILLCCASLALLGVVAGQNAPEILVAPSAMHVDYGSTAYMACVAYVGTESQSIGALTLVNWYNPHSQQLTNTSDGSVTVTTTVKVQNGQYFLKSILKVCNFTTNDFGSYTCRATNVYGQDEKTWIVSIVRLPIAPQLVTSPTSLTTTAGNTVYMTCSAYGYPYPIITWTRDGQTVQSDGILTIDNQIKNYNGANVSVSTLRICGADSDYVGMYTCTARVRDNPQVVTSTPWRLDVPPVPQITNAPDNLTINYGVTAYMTCTAYLGTVGQRADSLSSTLSWYGPNSQQIANSTDGSVSVYAEMVTQNGQVFIKSYLKLCNFSQANVGGYSCRVNNPNGQDDKSWNIDFPFPVVAPQMVAVPSAQTVTEGNTVYMTCAVYGYPFPDVTWYKNNAVLGPSSTNSTLSISTDIVNYNGAQLVQSTLKICLVGIEDIGSYSCRATTRDFGMVRSPDVSLNVLQVPAIIVAPKSQDITYGVTFAMSCAAHVGNTAQNADQLATTLTWRGPDAQPLTNATTGVTVYTDTMTSSQGHVIIKSVIQICGFVQALQGNYSCTVSNANGQDSRSWANTLPRQPIAPTVVVSPSTRTVGEGNSVIMACSGYGYPYPRITWYRNGQPLDPNSMAGRIAITTRIANYLGAPITESVMKICGAGEEDHGSYYCSFASSFGNPVNTNTWQVNVSPAPTIVVAPQSQNVEYGNTVYMTCAAHIGTENQVSGSLQSGTAFVWLGPDSQPINDSQIVTDTSTQSGRVFVRSVLTVCNFARENAGRYTCVVANDIGSENRTWTATFPATPTLPQLAAVSSYESVTYGHTVYITCAVYGYPQPQISWTLNGTALDTASTTVTTNTITVNNLNVTQSVVRVCGFRSTNVGLYLCSATNGVGTTLGYVNVIPEAPEIVSSPTNRMVNYAHTIYMSCIAYVGRMNRSVDQLGTTFSWWDNSNNQLSNSSDGSVSVYTDSFTQSGLIFMRSVLKICNFTQPDTGRHTCTAMNSNGRGSASWNLTFLRTPLPPQFLVTPRIFPVTGGYGNTLYMECAAYGFPFPQITWTLNGQVIRPNDTMYRVNYSTDIVNYGGAQVSQSVLKICGIGEEDIGSYVCTATTNALASTISSSPVTVAVNPVPSIVVAPQDQEVTFGTTTLMTCVAFVGLTTQNAANIPTTLSWWDPSLQRLANNTDNSVTIYSRTTTQGSRVFVESILKMCNFSHDLQGMYSCQVSNDNGDDGRAWNVSLHQEPFAPSLVAYPMSQSNRRFGFTVLMLCAAYGYPPPTITFSQSGQAISQEDLDRGRFRQRNSVQSYLGGVDISMGVLEICYFDYDDAVNYRCTATARNVGTVTSDPWIINVTAAPYLVSSPMSQNVSYDTVLRMTCVAALGNPSDAQYTTITWYDSNMIQIDNSSASASVYSFNWTNSTDNVVYLTSVAVVSDLGLMHLGELSCVANNSLGWDVARWNITPVLNYVAPQGVSIANTSQTIDCSVPVTLTCRAWGYPPPTIIWTLNGNGTSADNQVITSTLGLNYTDSVLMISAFNMKNDGTYVCNASNDVGTAKSQPVQLTLESTEKIETSAPKISSSIRTSSALAVITFQPVSTNSNYEFQVSYYNNSNSSATPDLNQLPKIGVEQSPDTQITIKKLNTCYTYWAVVTVVNRCGVRRSDDSTPSLVGLHDVTTYEVLVTLPSKLCTVWITEDTKTKVTDMTTRINNAASSCGISIPCIASSQWKCSKDKPMEATFSTQLVGDMLTPTTSIISCINTWIKDNSNLMIGGTSYMVDVAEVSQPATSVNATTVGVAVVVVIVVLVGIIVAVIIAIFVYKGRNRRPVKKEKLEEQRDEADMYSRHSFAVVENPLFADTEEGDDTSYSGSGGADGFEYDGTLDRKEDLGADDYYDDLDDDDKDFI